MTTRDGRTVWAALACALVVAIGGCGGEAGPPPPELPRPPPADGAFGVFAAFAPEFAPFWTSLGLDYAGYQDWAGGRLDDLGATWTRSNLQLVWDFVEPVPGAGFDWTASFEGDAVFAAAARYGVHYLAVFHEGGALPPMPPLRDPLEDLDGYSRFVEAVVERYDGDGLDDAPVGAVVRHWQVGNETGAWSVSGRSAEDYVRWFEATAAAIRRADPEARVALIASTDGEHVDALHASAITALAARGVRVDTVDLHHWGKADLASSTMEAVPAYRALLDGAGMRDAEIWSCEHGTYVGTPVTEPGTCTPACPADRVCSPHRVCVPRCGGPLACPASLPLCDAESGLCVADTPPQDAVDQARSLVYRYVVNRELGVRRILWNNLAAWRCFGGQCGGFFDRVGLVADGYGPGETLADAGRPRLAYFAFRMLAARADDPVASPDGRLDVGDPALHVHAYRIRATGRRALVAWADAHQDATLPFAGAAALVTGFITDPDGMPLRSERIAAAGGQLVVHLDPDPVWIEEVP